MVDRAVDNRHLYWLTVHILRPARTKRLLFLLLVVVVVRIGAELFVFSDVAHLGPVLLLVVVLGE